MSLSNHLAGLNESRSGPTHCHSHSLMPLLLQGSRKDQVTNVYQEKRDGLSASSPVSLARVLAAKGDLLSITKTNDPSVRSHTQCSINKILIGKVRGCGQPG